MIKTSIIFLLLISISAFLTGFFFKKNKTIPNENVANKVSTFYNIEINDINLKKMNLDKFKGHPILVVNVASRCGFTPQYTGLQALYETYKNDGLIIIGVPSNDFGGQEPKKEIDIKSFCELNYGVTFPLTEKIHVKGKNQHPLYKFLTSNNPNFSGNVGWNFTKFLIDQNGNVVNRFSSMTKPSSKKILTNIERLLNNKNIKN